jgi:hypothetical protein
MGSGFADGRWCLQCLALASPRTGPRALSAAQSEPHRSATLRSSPTRTRERPLRALILFWCDPAAIALTMAASAQRSTPERREAQLGSGTERENLHGAAKGKGTSGSNREAESTDAPARGAPPRSGDEAG